MSLLDPDIRFFRLPQTADRDWIGQFAATLGARVLRGEPFSCLVTTDKELRRLNRDFRGKDCPTDVLSFPAPDPKTYAGDVAISWQRAREQAAEFGHSLEQEIALLMLHGALHLSGLDHETDEGQMSRAEKRWRKALGLPSGLIERTRR